MAGEKWTDEEVSTAIAMRAEGKSTKEIAEKLGRSEGTTAVKLCTLRKSGQLESNEEVEPAPVEETAPSVPVPEEAIDILSGKVEEMDRQIILINRRLQELTESRDRLRRWLNSVRKRSVMDLKED